MSEKSIGSIPPQVPNRDIRTERVITPTIARLMAKREKGRARRYAPGIPIPVMGRATAAHPLGVPALLIIAFHMRVQQEDVVKIRPSILQEAGIARRRWLRVLAALEKAGLVTTEIRPGRPTLVGITDAEYLRWLNFKS